MDVIRWVKGRYDIQVRRRKWVVLKLACLEQKKFRQNCKANESSNDLDLRVDI